MEWKEEVLNDESGKTLEQVVQKGSGGTIFRKAWLDGGLGNLF